MTPILNHYFARINWLGAAAANIDTLRALHLKHNCTIPFENLDVLLPREIQLDDQSLEEKLVIARRGGYCFEQNGVFERVLRELGFNVRSLLGRVVLSNPPALPPRTHRLLLVELEGEKWIADVGFGGQTLTAPIRLMPDIMQTTPHGEYRLLQEGDDWVLQFNLRAATKRLCDRQFLVGALAAVAFSPSFADVSPFAGRWQANADQFSFYPL